VSGLPGRSSRLLRRISWSLEGTGVDLVVSPALTDVAGPRIHVRPMSGLPLLHVEEPDFHGARRIVKGVSDWVAGAFLTLLALPVLILIAVAIKVSDRGPVFFRQTRVGVHGREFPCLKFRSMVVDAEERLAKLQAANEHDGVLFKIKDDPRVTGVGKIIRRLSLDELPQLFNVLRGEMSLVGPRPPLPSEVEQYGDDVKRRLLVKPGITGLWQVSGRSNLSWEDSVRLDLYYVENWSLSTDIVILAKTIRAVLSRDGAY
jgi:exopolysaccharide biosynthesis polyprenyl glycosylphosphotransferase